MSARKIKRLLRKKGCAVENIKFQRSCPVPEGFSSGYDIELSEQVVDELFSRGAHNVDEFMEFGSLDEVEMWIDLIPNNQRGE